MKHEHALGNQFNGAVPCPQYNQSSKKRRKGHLIQTKCEILRLGKQKPKRRSYQNKPQRFIWKYKSFIFKRTAKQQKINGKRRPTAQGQGCNEEKCPRHSRISHLLFCVSALWAKRIFMDIYKGGLILKVSEGILRWPFLQIQFSPAQENYISWCLSDYRV